MQFFLYILYALIALSAGLGIAFGYMSLVVSVGIVRNVIRTFKIADYKMILIIGLILGLTLGSICTMDLNFHLLLGNYGKFIAGFCGIFYGVFVGYLALGLAEVFDVIPVLDNRLGFRSNVKLIVLTCAIGKMLGSLTYFIMPGFFEIK